MKNFNLREMIKGWFVGNFEPTAYQTSACEVAIKYYKEGDQESAHFHKIATEITIVISGIIYMAGREWREGDIIILEPGEITDFRAVTDSINAVVKIPGAKNDKYIA